MIILCETGGVRSSCVRDSLAARCYEIHKGKRHVGDGEQCFSLIRQQPAFSTAGSVVIRRNNYRCTRDLSFCATLSRIN